MTTTPPPLPPPLPPSPPPLPTTKPGRVPKEEVQAFLDRGFVALGLTPGRYLVGGRQYHGTVEGRLVDVYLRPVYFRSNPGLPSQYHGHDLELYVRGGFRTRLSLVHKKSVNSWVETKLIKLTALEVKEVEEAGLALHAQDEIWARGFFESGKSTVLNVAQRDGGRCMSSLRVYPSVLNLNCRQYWNAYTPEKIHSFVQDLLRLAEIGESLPPPYPPQVETQKERGFYDRSKTIPWGCLGVGIAVAFICFVLFTLIQLNT